MLPIKYLTIHCTATPEGRDFGVSGINAIAAQRFGPGGKSYHWIVTIDGVKHRNIQDNVRGIHVANNNTGNIGVVYEGGLAADGKTPKDTRTEAQKTALLEIVAEYRKRYPGIVIRGHRDWSPDLDGDGTIEPHEYIKACPSFDVAEFLKAAPAPVTPAPPSAPKPDLKPSVRALQGVLNGILGANLDVDGLVGPKTRAAYAEVKTKLGL